MSNNTQLPVGSGGDNLRTIDRGSYKVPVSLIDVGSGSEAIVGVSGNSMPVAGVGIAGTANTGVMTIQGIAGMTSVKVDGSAVTQPVSIASVPSHDVTNTGVFVTQINGSGLTSLQLLDDTVYTDSTTFTYGSSKELVVAGVGWDGMTVTAPGVARALSLTADMELRTHDSEAIICLQTIDNAISGSGFNISQFGGASVPIGAGAEATAIRVTLPIDGTGKVFAAQSGTWNIANITGTISLPTGAATAAKQPALGTAGTASSDVITVQGIASMTALKVDGSAVTQPVSLASVPSHAVTNTGIFAVQATIAAATTSIGKEEDVASANADVGVPALAVRKATPANTSGTDGDYEFLQMSAGRLWTSSTIDAALPSGSNTIGAVNIAAGQTLATLTSITNVVHVDDNSGSLTIDAPVGTPAFVRLSDGSSAISTLPVSISSVPVHAVTQSGIWNVGVTGTVTVGSHAVTNTGVFATQIDGAALTSLQLIDDPVTTISTTKVMRVAIMDAADAQITSFGGGTQYTEDVAAAADPQGNATILVRKDTPSTITTTDGDNVAQRGTNYGAAYCQLVTSAGAYIDSVGGGTQYAENVTNTAPTGNVMLWKNSSTLRAVSETYPLPSVVTQSGTWTVGISAAQTLANVTTLGTITNVVAVNDNAGSLTVDAPVGTPVFVRLSDGSTAISTLPVSLTGVPSHPVTQSGTWNINDVSGVVSLPTGASTAAKQPALGTAGTASADVITVQGIASMTALKVDGSAVTQPISGTVTATINASATTFVKAEDDASANLDVGVACMAVRNATPANTSGTDGDYEMLQMSAGRLWTSAVIDTALPSGTNTIGAVNIAAAQTLATVTTVGTITNVVNVADNSSSLTVDAPVATPVFVRLSDGSAAITTLPVSLTGVPSHHVTNTGIFITQENGAALTALQLLDDAVVAQNTALGSTKNSLIAGSVTTAAPSYTTGTINPISMTTAGAIRVDSSAVTQRISMSGIVVPVTGNVAHDAVDSGSPVKIGMRAVGALTGVTLVSSGDRTDVVGGCDGVMIMRPYCPLEDIISDNKTNTDGVSTNFTSGMAAPGSGVRIYVTGITMTNTSASDITVDVRDGSGGSVLWTMPVPSSGGAIQPFHVPLKLSANTALAFDGSAAASTLTVSAVGFKSKGG